MIVMMVAPTTTRTTTAAAVGPVHFSFVFNPWARIILYSGVSKKKEKKRIIYQV